MIANNLINRVGVNFIGKMRGESGAPFVSVVKAYLIVSEAYKTESLFSMIEAKDGAIPADKQSDEMRRIVAEIENMTLTVLRNGMDEDDVAGEIKEWEKRQDEKFSALRADFSA